MFFIGRKTTGELQLTTPLDYCCNCGTKGEIELVQTPLQQTRFFLFFGTELELIETFPYCKRCKASAKRVRLGWMSKLMVACAAAPAVLLGLIWSGSASSKFVQGHLFSVSALVGLALTAAYFQWRERKGGPRSYYQPVGLLGANLAGGSLRQIHLCFSNPDYARLFVLANAEQMAAQFIKVETRHPPSRRPPVAPGGRGKSARPH